VSDDPGHELGDRQPCDQGERDRQRPAVGMQTVVLVPVVTWHETRMKANHWETVLSEAANVRLDMT
jgi:hypothetical protein